MPSPSTSPSSRRAPYAQNFFITGIYDNRPPRRRSRSPGSRESRKYFFLYLTSFDVFQVFLRPALMALSTLDDGIAQCPGAVFFQLGRSGLIRMPPSSFMRLPSNFLK